MIYKFEYQVDSDPKPHHRYYNALDESTATSMFEATCEQSLTGESVVLLTVVECDTRDHQDGEDEGES